MKKVLLGALGIGLLVAAGTTLAASGIGAVADKVISNLAGITKLITAGSYVAGMAFSVGAIVKFKAHKDNPTQIPIGTPIALLFVGAALLFLPSILKVSGSTLFSGGGETAGVGGIASFGTQYKKSGG